jgi:hypothetical protein
MVGAAGLSSVGLRSQFKTKVKTKTKTKTTNRNLL